MKIQLQALKNLIRESLLTETACPSCGDPNAYVGFSSVECPNHGCEHYVASQQAIKDDGKDETWEFFRTEYPSEHAAWLDFVMYDPRESTSDPKGFTFDTYLGDIPMVTSADTGKTYTYDEGEWVDADELDAGSPGDYDDPDYADPDDDGSYGDDEEDDMGGDYDPNLGPNYNKKAPIRSILP